MKIVSLNSSNILIKTAAPADKVAKLKLTDPYAIFFVYSNENLVDLNKIKNEKQLLEFIETNLMPNVHQLIDPDSKNNRYTKEISDMAIEGHIAGHPGDPETQRIGTIYKTDKARAKKEYLASVNADKQEEFFNWWNFFRQENPTYKANPSFSFCMLKKIFEMFPQENTQTITSLDQDVIADIFESVRTNPKNAINLQKLYVKKLGEKNEKGMIRKDPKKDEGWKIIYRKSVDPDGFQDRIRVLKDFSVPNGWCTGTTMAEPYLTAGDFHLFIKNKSARVAIRMQDDKQILEIRGPHNAVAYEYWEEVLRYIRENNFITNKGHYSSNPAFDLEAAEKTNQQLKNDERFRENYRNILRGGTDIQVEYEKLSKENKELFLEEVVSGYVKTTNTKTNAAANNGYVYADEFLDEFFIRTDNVLLNNIPKDSIEKIINYWVKRVEKNPKELLGKMSNAVRRRLPVGFESKAWENRLGHLSGYELRNEYPNCPDGIRLNLSEKIKQRVVADWLGHFTRGKSQFKEFSGCPQEIKDMMTPEQLRLPIESMFKIVNNNPAEYDRDMPVEVWEPLPQEIKQKVRLYWGKQIYEAPKRFESCPDEVRKTFPQDFEMKAWNRYVKANPSRYPSKWVPNHVRTQLAEDTVQTVISFYENHAKNNPARVIEDTPKEILDKFSEESRRDLAGKLAGYSADFPDFIKSLPESISRYMSLDLERDVWSKKIMDDPENWDKAPEKVKISLGDTKLRVQSWFNVLMNNPLKYYDCPEEVLNQLSQTWKVNLWAKYIRVNLGGFNRLPPEIRPLIPQATIDTVARNFASILIKSPVTREYAREQFRTFWPRDPAVLNALPEQAKEKLRSIGVVMPGENRPREKTDQENVNASWYGDYRLAKLIDVGVETDPIINVTCAYCNRWATHDDEYAPRKEAVWKKQEMLDPEERARSEASLVEGASHGFCPKCVKIIEELLERKLPLNKNVIRSLSLKMD